MEMRIGRLMTHETDSATTEPILPCMGKSIYRGERETFFGDGMIKISRNLFSKLIIIMVVLLELLYELYIM